jgi:SAM-dependent methyltransferase
MTEQGERTSAAWQDAAFASSWADRDRNRNLLGFPRALAAGLVADTDPQPQLVVDIGSGPGDFLAVFLEAFPSARGVWTDASDAMRELAQERLRPYGDRVIYRIVDMTQIGGQEDLTSADVVTTSRAAHHLDRDGLHAFYAEATRLLVPGGWLVNLDHTGSGDVWDARFRRVRKRLVGSSSKEPKLKPHRHEHPLTTVRDHLDGLSAAGLIEVEVAWKACHTCLFVGRRPERA